MFKSFPALGKEETLQKLRSQRGTGVNFGMGFNPFGQDHAADTTTKINQGFYCFLLKEVAIHMGHQMAIEFDDVGTQLGDAGQITVTCSKIVKCNEKAMPAISINEVS